MAEKQNIDERAMPLLDHLVELRSRLIHSAIAILILFFICYYFSPSIYNFLVAPLADVLEQMGGQRRLIFTALHEAFFTYIKVAFFAAIFLSFPFLLSKYGCLLHLAFTRMKKELLPHFLLLRPYFSLWVEH